MTTDLTKTLPEQADVIAPDGLEVRILLSGQGGSMAHFHLAAGRTGRAVRHRTVEEIWYFTEGSGAFWRESQGVTEASPGVCVKIPVGTAFQVKAGVTGLSAVAITMPPWPGDDEAQVVEGIWPPSL